MQIQYVDWLKTSPAAMNHNTGDLYLNAKVWPMLSADKKKFVILHELGHWFAGKSETDADNFAFTYMSRIDGSTEKPLLTSVLALADILSNSPQGIKRTKQMYYNALAYDANINKNAKAMKAIEDLNRNTNMELGNNNFDAMFPRFRDVVVPQPVKVAPSQSAEKPKTANNIPFKIEPVIPDKSPFPTENEFLKLISENREEINRVLVDSGLKPDTKPTPGPESNGNIKIEIPSTQITATNWFYVVAAIVAAYLLKKIITG